MKNLASFYETLVVICVTLSIFYFDYDHHGRGENDTTALHFKKHVQGSDDIKLKEFLEPCSNFNAQKGH